MPRYVTVPGTWGEDDAWWRPGSLWARWMAGQGWTPVQPTEPYIWSGDLDGALLDRLTGRIHRDWRAAGAALAYYLTRVPPEDRIVIAHSHGGQVVAYCAAGQDDVPPVALRAAITVCTPVREDMTTVWRDALPRILTSAHYWAPGWKNRMQFLGQLFDGRLGLPGELRDAAINVRLPAAAGHSGLLHDARYFPLLEPTLTAIRGGS